ncbi:hypothetical protein Sjap_004581 [Stephania japonica]|uniref:Uncharacterized protein n=1 Tax=Stephania japonica TaxID=461633 RepID=A0AAP0K405_9MAGN
MQCNEIGGWTCETLLNNWKFAIDSRTAGRAHKKEKLNVPYLKKQSLFASSLPLTDVRTHCQTYWSFNLFPFLNIDFSSFQHFFS